MTAPPAAPKTLFHARSAYQDVALHLEADGSLSLTLDDFWQFSSRDEHIFHELLVDAALVQAPHLDRVLVLGGGDGLALRNVLRYADVQQAVLCELDEVVLSTTRDVPEMAALCEQSTNDARAELIVGDARDYVRATHDPFDVIICDFPVLGTSEHAPGIEAEFLAALQQRLKPEGVLSVQVSLDPPAFWQAVAPLQAAFAHHQLRLAALADETWADFALASAAPLQPRRPLADGVRYLNATRLATTQIENRDGPTLVTAEHGSVDFTPSWGD